MKEFVEKLIGVFKCEELRTELICVSDVVSIINQLAEKYLANTKKNSAGWIPCGERLPEELDIQYQALEYFPEYNVTIVGAEKSTTLHYLGDGEWSDAEGNSYNVIAWQQLPEVYRPGEEKDGVKNAWTRIECIRSMSVEELADAIMENDELAVSLDFCQSFKECKEIIGVGDMISDEKCKKCLIKWLNSPVEQKKTIPTEHFKERFNKVI